MKLSNKCVLLVPFLVLIIAISSFAASAETPDGWNADSEGVVRYYKDGAPVVGTHKIGAYNYTFASDGEYIGVYDGHVNVGKIDIGESVDYETALKQFVVGGGKVYSYHTFDENEMFTKNDFSVSVPSAGSLEEYSTSSDKGSYIESVLRKYSRVDGIYESKSHYVYSVQRGTFFETVRRGNGSALHVTSSKTASAHSYIDVTFSGHEAGKDIVIEIDYKLGEGYNHSSGIFAVRDNNNPDQIALGGSTKNYTPNLLTLNPNGGVYINSEANGLIAVLNTEEYTRLSVAIHPATNSMDVYVNGFLVADEVAFLTNASYDPMKFQAEMLRGAQLNGQDLGSLYVDNFAAYNASKPLCTVEEEGRNGIYREGDVLRYYRNGMVAVGNIEVTGSVDGLTFNGERLNFGTLDGNGAYPLGNKATVKVNGNILSEAVIEGNIFIAPEEKVTDKGVFGGWRVTDGSTSLLLSPGDIYTMNGDITCEAVEMELSMLAGASIKIADSGLSALRFIAKVDKNTYDALISAGAKVETHVLIAPDEYFEQTYGYYTVEALKESGFNDFVDVNVTSWFAANDNYNYFAGEVQGIPLSDYAKKYSAVAYMKIIYPNGTEIKVYTDFSANENSRCVYEVAHAAYNDRSDTKKAQYSVKTRLSKKNYFSPYSKKKLEVIKKYADTVIMLEASGDAVKSAGDFYTAPYNVTSSFNSDSGRNEIAVESKSGWSLSDALCVVYNGRRLGADEYTMDGICAFSVEAIKYDISDLTSESEELKSWLMVDPRIDGDYLYGAFTEEEYIHKDQTAAASLYWPYNIGDLNIYPSQIRTLGLRGNASAYYAVEEMGTYYYDFSDWQAISFYVWSSKDSQTFRLLFYSENPSSGGSDYYSTQINLKSGWNEFVLPKSQFSAGRSPLGWNRISGISFNITGWNQTNDTGTVLFISEITAYNDQRAASPLVHSDFEDATVFVNGGYFVSVNGEQVLIEDGDGYNTVFEENGVQYVPLASVAAGKGGVGAYYPDEGVLKFNYLGKDYVFEQGKRNYTVGGEKAELAVAPVARGRALFLSADDIKAIFGYAHKYVDRMGLTVLSNTENILDKDADYDRIYSGIEELIYVRPSGEQIISDLNENTGGQHPYLMVDGEGFERLRYYARMDATMQAYIKKLEGSYGVGTSKFNAAVNVYKITDGKRLLSISRDVMNKTITWALLAKLYEYKDPELFEKYAERCWKEIESACNFKDENGLYSWHPDHFLDTAELAYPVAICYDWLYDYWIKTDANVDAKKYGYNGGATRRQVMEDAMYWMALSVSNVLPSDTTGKYVSGNYSIAGSTNNWNGVCNGGLMAAALAICNVDRYKDGVKTYIDAGITAIESGMWVYAPDGGYEEGPGYWSYGTTYTQVFISCLDSACGTNYGIYNAPGFGHSVYFTTYLGSKNTTWGFHDGGSGSADTNIASWFAKKDNDPNVNAIRRQAIDNGWKAVSMYDVMYYDPHVMTATITLGLDSYYSLDSIMTFRSSWDVKDSIFTGLHGGDNAASHGDLDIGNFVINVNGSFVISELGSEKYNTAGYFGNYRWSYYRKRAEGQNTIVMLPSRENVNGNGWNGKTGRPCIIDEKANKEGSTNLPIADQIKTAVSKVLRYETGTNSAIGVVDMSPAYTQMTEGVRGLYFTDNRQTVIIQDEAKFSENMDIWWFAHTQGEITISDDGRSAVIAYNGVYLYAEIITDMTANVSFSRMEAESLDKRYVGDTVDSSYYTDDVESSRSGISKLCITVDDVSELRLAVAFRVIDGQNSVPELGTIYKWQDISSWRVD